MNFQIRALPREQFSHLFGAPDEQLSEAGVARVHVEQSPGYPCRVSLRDAKVGETVLLLNYEHLGEDSPYRASHAIFVVEGAEDVTPAVNEIPDVLRTRLISVRGFNQDHHMIAADVCEGSDLAAKIQDMATVEDMDYLHLHNAKPGCFAAKVDLLPASPAAV